MGDRARPGRCVAGVEFKTEATAAFWPVIAATTLAFFAMVGFEDSVNMAEETQGSDPPFSEGPARRAGDHRAIYVLVSISAITLVRPSSSAKARRRCCRSQAGAPNFPAQIFGFITMFAVANSALINMLMASRLVYGMSREHVLPRCSARST